MIKEKNKIAGYRATLGLKYKDMAKMLDISIPAYGVKEKNKKFNDKEKIILVDFFKQHFEDVTIESLFF